MNFENIFFSLTDSGMMLYMTTKLGKNGEKKYRAMFVY